MHLTPAQNERLRAAMRQTLGARYKSTVEMARALKRSQPSISQFLARRQGASYETARRFARLVEKPLEDVIGDSELYAESKESELLFELPRNLPLPRMKYEAAARGAYVEGVPPAIAMEWYKAHADEDLAELSVEQIIVEMKALYRVQRKGSAPQPARARR